VEIDKSFHGRISFDEKSRSSGLGFRFDGSSITNAAVGNKAI
jgi:hypothetical protein